MSEGLEQCLFSKSDSGPPSYRVIVQSDDNAVASVTPISVADDEAAKAAARSIANGRAAEVWDGLRFIEHFHGND